MHIKVRRSFSNAGPNSLIQSHRGMQIQGKLETETRQRRGLETGEERELRRSLDKERDIDKH